MARPLPYGQRSSRRLLSCLGLLVGLVPGTALGVQKPRPEDRVLPNFDTRLWGARPLGDPAEVERALEDLRGRRSLTLEARFHAGTRALRLLAAREGALTSDSAAAPEDIARGFVRANRGLFGLRESDVAGLVRTRQYESRRDLIRHVLFQQEIDGIPVFGGVIGVHLDAAGRVVFVSNNSVGDADAARGPRLPGQPPALDAEDAVRAGVANIRPELSFEPRVVSAPRGRDRRAAFARGPLKRDVGARLVYFPAQPRPRLAWRMLVEPAGFPQSYDVIVDAENGEVLYRHNRVYYADGVGSVVQSAATFAQDPRRPDDHPTGSGAAGPGDPASGCPPLQGYSARDLTAPFRDPATVLSNTGRLTGNNTRTYLGFPGVFGALGSADPEGRWHFEYPFGSSGAAETQLFFATNFLHDFFYDLGFDEAAGNFQQNNFGRGGLGGDAVNAVARADGRNNATFEPQPEGTSPTISMFLFDGSGCWSEDVDGDGVEDLDGDFDLDIIAHEFGHGVSTRLNTDWTGDEADAMGEGFSDFFAYSITGDTKLAESVMPPDGIRAVNAKTYADWFCFDFFGFFFFCEPHDNGEIWVNTMWDMREQFRTDLVEGSEAAAINEVLQLSIDGLKLSPASPTMLDLRDAMLQADLIRNPSGGLGGSENYCRMWLAFSGRGMGVAALDTQDTGDGTVVADFSVPVGCPGKPVVTVTASDAGAAEAGLDTAAFTFSRSGSTDADLVVSYVVSGTATPGSDYVALAGTLTIPAGSADATLILTPIDDTHVEPDESVDIEIGPSFAYIIGSPAVATAMIVSEDVAPDLRVTVSVPLLAGAGSTITVTDATSNIGTEASPSSLTRFYLSPDDAVDASDVVLGSRPVPALAIGASSTATTAVTLPPTLAAGVYYVIARADDDGSIEEIFENNNLGLGAVRVGPDLALLTLAPITSGAGATVTLSDTTHNYGGGAAAASSTTYYLSANAALDPSDAPLGSRAVPALAPGTGSAGSTTGTIPAATATGIYYLIAQADGGGAVPETFETNNVAYAIASIGPDLIVPTLAVTPSAGAGSTLSVNDTTRNQGGGSAAASTTRFYLSTDGTVGPTDTLLGSREVEPLAAGASSSGTTSVTIPAGTASGTYYVLAVADGATAVPEYNEANNTAWAGIQIGPDFTVPALTVPATTGAGSSIAAFDTTRNQGGGSADASTTRFYLSTDGAVGPTDTLLGSRDVPPLVAGANSSATTTLLIPAGTAAGFYYVLAQADGLAAVAETVETNNVSYAYLQVGPDLIVSAFTAPASSGQGASIIVNDTTRNQSQGAAPASTTRFYLSTNGAVDAGDTLLGARSVPALAGGSDSAGATALTIPAGTPAGVYFVLALADGDGAVGEYNESNNTSWAAIQIGPDLTITALSAPPSAAAGAAISVGDTTRNQGGGSALASTTSFYLSTNGVVDAGDAVLGSRAVPALAAGASSSGTTSVTIPAGTAAGAYYVLAQADAAGAIGETVEGNNTSYASVMIGPDLTITAVTAPATAGAGAAISVGDTTRNQGGAAAPASVTNLYLSVNPAVDASDTLLGSRAVPALAAGVSSSGTTTVTIPAGTAAGAYYVLAQADAPGAVGETVETNNVSYAYVQVGPDLIVSALSAPASSGAGLSIAVNDTTRNQGGAAAPASVTNLFLSVNAAVDASDTLLGSRAVPALAAGVSSSGTTTVTIPAGTTPGAYYVLAQADGPSAVAETAENNNSNYAYVVIGPDLTITAVTAPATAGAGAAISVGDTTRNQGGAAAPASVTNLYLSVNAVVDASDTLLGSRAVPALAAGVSSSGTTTVTIPAGTAAGGYYVLAQADGGGAVAETAETNNVYYAYVQVGPDLIVSALTAPASSGEGLSVAVNDTTRNQSSGPAPASTTKFYLSTNGALDAGDTLLGGRAVPALAGATNSSATTTLTIPAGTAPGPYYLLAQADGDAVVLETVETNNTAYAFLWIGPDLTITTVTAPATAAAGAAINVGDTTRNQGGGAAATSTTRFYLSTNGAVDGGDTLLGSREVGPLAAGANSSSTTALTIPAGTAAGGYYVLAQADGPGAIAETLETNNVYYAYVQIGPDLIISALTAPATSGAGLSITVNDTTRNQGGGAAPASTTRFYLSTNGAVDAGDTLLGSREVEPLAAGANSPAATSLTIPAGTAAGAYYVLAQADGPGAIGETIETNNVSYAYVQVGPDLTITAITVPATAGAGSAITVNETTRNQGGGAAGASTTRFYLSTNGAVDAGDTLLGSREVEPLAPATNSAAATSLTIPAGTAPGTYYVLAQADGGAVVGETFEFNNVNYAVMQVGPDLLVSALSAPASGGAGASINVDDTTRNQGGGAAAASTTRFYLSTNGAVDAGDTLLGTRAVPALGAGTNGAGSTLLTIPAGTSPGIYYLLAVADGENALPETVETNNLTWRQLQVTP